MPYLGLSIRGGERREEELRFARRLGYTAVEISMDGTGLIFGGQLHPQMLRNALAAFGKQDFRYSVHSPSSLDLRDRANRENHLALARAALQFCRAAGGRILVIHFEQQSQDPEDEAAFEDAVRRLSDEAGDVLLGIENIEVERVDPVIDCVRRLNRPNVVMTLDIGHAYLASVYFRFDFFEAVRAVLPFVRHVHVNDNFGRYDPLRLENFTLYRTQTPADTYPLGKGDLHLPVGWGTIPLEKVFGLLRGFRGTVVHEYRYNLFLGSAEEDYARVQNLVAMLEDPAPGPEKGR
ncbi:MAG TPA: sugar phosphate isomerase/epimerase family protein [bacterium]|nr:sugar phosphate isomerase/epimerase family protein [bacterium]